MLEAFMESEFPLCRPPPTSTMQHPGATTSSAPDPSRVHFSQKIRLNWLQSLIESSQDWWTCVILWQPSVHQLGGVPFLVWGDGYYREEEPRRPRRTTSSAQQALRKKLIQHISSLISGSPPLVDDSDVVDEEVTDSEWFYLMSMTHTFGNEIGLAGYVFLARQPQWLVGPDHLASSYCDRVRQAHSLCIQTIACIPAGNGVVELGSTQMVLANQELMQEVKSIFAEVNICRARSRP